MSPLALIQRHLDNNEQSLAHEAAVAAGLIVSVCLIDSKAYGSAEAARGGLSHGLCSRSCVSEYKRRFCGGKAA